MATIYNSIRSLVNPARIATAATTLGESEHKVSAATDIILPSLLGCMLQKGNTPEVEDVLTEAKKLKTWENYDNIWQGSGVDGHVNIGERMENRLLGNHDPKFNSAVDHATGMKAGSADRLTNWVAATIAAWFGGEMAGGTSYKTLLGRIAGEKSELGKGIPSGILAELGLGGTLGVAAASTATRKSTSAPAPKPKKKGSLAWLWWLLGILALLLIIWLCARSCCAKRDAVVVQETVVVPEQVVEVREVRVAPKFEAVPMVIDGHNITIYTGDMERAVDAFLKSDKFKNATDEQLKTVWFEFSDIDFEHNSATELQDSLSRTKLVSLVNVLKKYPESKIKIGAFADKTGTHAANFAISEARAETIRKALVEAGFPAANISVEGFGNTYATVAESATDIERSPDRDIAMRFTK
jgi:outer membrane protein OmpA-like peptidoglycan-associated protein